MERVPLKLFSARHSFAMAMNFFTTAALFPTSPTLTTSLLTHFDTTLKRVIIASTFGDALSFSAFTHLWLSSSRGWMDEKREWSSRVSWRATSTGSRWRRGEEEEGEGEGREGERARFNAEGERGMSEMEREKAAMLLFALTFSLTLTPSTDDTSVSDDSILPLRLRPSTPPPFPPPPPPPPPPACRLRWCTCRSFGEGEANSLTPPSPPR
mmetsp:Transcript_21782/g.56575  ORF Transcript_21782/g.56575 Transcript_21782/m.56575 type:complete len:211 (+) Transcript_21782:558-1190(+)